MDNTPTFSLANVLANPKSTWAGITTLFGVLATAMSGGFPTTQAGWVTFALAVLNGVGAVFSKA
jgi:hypothetical protein